MAELVRLPDVAMVALRRRERDGLPAVGETVARGSDRIVAIGPDEWLIVGGDGDAACLLDRTAGLGGIQVDVSGNRVAYRVAGPGALALLSSGCALDLEALSPGDAVSTLLARAQVIILREADGFAVMPRRSFGRYLEEWADAAIG